MQHPLNTDNIKMLFDHMMTAENKLIQPKRAFSGQTRPFIQGSNLHCVTVLKM